jgi:hypothetical protein
MAPKLLAELEELELTPAQIQLINGFYSGRREAIDRNRIPHKTLEAISAKIQYESDLAVGIMQQLDDHLLDLMAKKDKKDHDNAIAKAGRKQ